LPADELDPLPNQSAGAAGPPFIYQNRISDLMFELIVEQVEKPNAGLPWVPIPDCDG
jgi:hypothetical protein